MSEECKEKVWNGEEVSGVCLDSPGFASSLIFELYEEDDGALYVELLYNNERLDVCGKDKKDCTLDEFI